MTKSDLITKVRDSLVSGNQKEAEDAIDERDKKLVTDFINWLYADESRFENSGESSQLYNLYLLSKQ